MIRAFKKHMYIYLSTFIFIYFHSINLIYKPRYVLIHSRVTWSFVVCTFILDETSFLSSAEILSSNVFGRNSKALNQQVIRNNGLMQINCCLTSKPIC